MNYRDQDNGILIIMFGLFHVIPNIPVVFLPAHEGTRDKDKSSPFKLCGMETTESDACTSSNMHGVS